MIQLFELDDQADVLEQVGTVDPETGEVDAPDYLDEIIMDFERENPEELIGRFDGPRYFAQSTDEDLARKDTSVDSEDSMYRPYIGPEGGTGWTDGEDVVYDEEPPGDINPRKLYDFMMELPQEDRSQARHDLGLAPPPSDAVSMSAEEIETDGFRDEMRIEADIDRDQIAEVADRVTEDVDWGDTEMAESTAIPTLGNLVTSDEQKRKIRDGLVEEFGEPAVDEVYDYVGAWKFAEAQRRTLQCIIDTVETEENDTYSVRNASQITQQQLAVATALSEISSEVFEQQFGEESQMQRGLTEDTSVGLLEQYIAASGNVDTVEMEEGEATSYTPDEDVAKYFNRGTTVAIGRDVEADDIAVAIDHATTVGGETAEAEFLETQKRSEVDANDIRITFEDTRTDRQRAVPIEDLPEVTYSGGDPIMPVYRAMKEVMLGMDDELIANSQLAKDVISYVMTEPAFEDERFIKEEIEEILEDVDLDIAVDKQQKAAEIMIDADEAEDDFWLSNAEYGQDDEQNEAEDELARKDGEWQPYIGPEGGTGWTNGDEVLYDQEPPGEIDQEAVDTFLDELPEEDREAARGSLGLGGDDFEQEWEDLLNYDLMEQSTTDVRSDAEDFLQERTSVGLVDFDDLLPKHIRHVGSKLKKLDDNYDLSGIDVFGDTGEMEDSFSLGGGETSGYFVANAGENDDEVHVVSKEKSVQKPGIPGIDDEEWLVTDDRYQTAVHEVAHYLHYQQFVEQFDDPDSEWDGYDDQLTDTQQQALEEEVGLYAGMNTFEAVAEIATGIMYGREFSDEVMEIYEEHAGPDVGDMGFEEMHWDEDPEDVGTLKDEQNPYEREAEIVQDSFETVFSRFRKQKLARKTEWELDVQSGVEGYYNADTDEFVPTREASVEVASDIHSKDGVDEELDRVIEEEQILEDLRGESDDGKDLWVPYLGPEGGTGWTDGEDVTYDDDPPGNALSLTDTMNEMFPNDVMADINDAIAEVHIGNDLDDGETDNLKRNLVGTYVRVLGMQEDSDGGLSLQNVEEADEIPVEQLAEEMVDSVKVPANERAAENIGFDGEKPIDEIVESGDVLEVDVSGLTDDKQRLGMAFDDTAEAEIIWIGEEYADVEVNGVPTQIDDLKEVEDIQFNDSPSDDELRANYDLDEFVGVVGDYFGDDSDVVDDLKNQITHLPENHIGVALDSTLDAAKENGYSSDQVRDFLDTVDANAFDYPDVEEITQFQNDPGVSNAPILNALMGMREEYDYTLRASDIEDGLDVEYAEASMQERLEAAQEQLSGFWQEGHEKEFIERILDQATPDTLYEAEVDDVAVGERLRGSFYYAEQRHDAREYGISGGNSTGDKMEVLEYADGSIDFAVPTRAYDGGAPTGVVDTKEEAIRNNRDSPKVVEALGGSVCETRIVEDQNGEEYILKEGLEGDELKGVGWNEPELEGEALESGIETLAAAYFVGNVDLHTSNLFYTDDEEISIIDHDSAGTTGMLDTIEPPTKIARHATGAGISQFDVERRAFDKAFKIKSGEIDLPDDISNDHQMFLDMATDKAVKLAVSDTSYTPPEADSEAFNPRIEREREMVDVLAEQDRVNIYQPKVGEQRTGTVQWVDEDNRYIRVEDDQGRMYEVDGDTLEETFLAQTDEEPERPDPAIDDFDELEAGRLIEVLDPDDRQVEAEVLNTFPDADPPFITVDTGANVFDVTNPADVLDDEVRPNFEPAASSDILDAIEGEFGDSP